MAGINLIGSDSPGYSLPDGKVRPAMQDLAMLLFTVVFFGLAFLYVKACQKLRQPMDIVTGIALILSVLLYGYLITTLLFPEKF